MGIPDHLTCLLRNVYAGQKATVRTGHGTTGWFQIGKRVCQGYILSVKIKQSQKKQISCHLNIFTYQTPARVLGKMILEVLILSLIFLKIFWFMCWPLALYRDRHRKKEENTKIRQTQFGTLGSKKLYQRTRTLRKNKDVFS